MKIDGAVIKLMDFSDLSSRGLLRDYEPSDGPSFQALIHFAPQVSFEERELNGACNPTFFGTPLSASTYSASSNRLVRRRHPLRCSGNYENIWKNIYFLIWFIKLEREQLQIKHAGVTQNKSINKISEQEGWRYLDLNWTNGLKKD